MLNYSLRDFKPIHDASRDSPVRQEFKSMMLRAKQDSETQFIYDEGMAKCTSQESMQV